MRVSAIRSGTLRGALAATVVVCLGITGTAFGAVTTHTAGGIKYVTDTVTTDPCCVSAIVVVPCPGKTHVIGGGQTNDAGYGEAAQSATYPYDLDDDADSKPDDAWRMVFGQNHEAHTLKVTAICAKTKVTYASKDFAFSPTPQSFARAKCPAGTHVYSGGWSADSAFNLNSSFPIDNQDSDHRRDDGWAIYVDGGGSATGTVYVACGERSPTYRKVNKPAPANQRTGVHIRCPKHRFVYGGGEENSGGYLEADASDLGPFGNTAPSRGWYTSVDNLTADEFTLEAFAICGQGFG
jgi:hypothetical protein